MPLFFSNVLPGARPHIPLNDGARILDIGCGAGVWIMVRKRSLPTVHLSDMQEKKKDMAIEYPNCDYEGIDIVNVVKPDMWPKRAKFKCGNIVESLDFPDNTFDFVHMRLFVLALRETEWPIALKEALRVIKPGGVIQLTEIDYKVTTIPTIYHKPTYLFLLDDRR